MRSGILAKAAAPILTVLAALVAFTALAQNPPPHIPPGTYSETYTCRDGAALPVEIYVLDQYEPAYKSDPTPYQKVRVEYADTVFVGQVIVNGMGRMRIVSRQYEKAPSGRPRVDSFDLDSIQGGLSGVTRYPHDECRLSPRYNPNAKSAATMAYATQKAPPAYEATPVPAGYAPFTPAPAQATAYLRQAQAAIRGDAESWGVNHLHPNSIGEARFYASGPSVLLRVSFVYANFYIDDVPGWAEVRFQNGSLECLRLHDRNACLRPRTGQAEQRASLGQGKPHLGPIEVAPTCFRTVQRFTPREPIYATVRTGENTLTRRITGYTGGQPYTVDVYQCPRQDFEIDCVGTGAVRDRSISLIPGSDAVTRAALNDLNARIADRSCVRTR